MMMRNPGRQESEIQWLSYKIPKSHGGIYDSGCFGKNGTVR
jgi:hypothetical protein